MYILGIILIAINIIGLYLMKKKNDNSIQTKSKKPPNPNPNRHAMRHDVINAGFKMFRNPDTCWDNWEKTPKWHGPAICYGVDFNNLIYNTTFGDYTSVRDLTEEEMLRLAKEIRKTDGLMEILDWADDKKLEY